MCFFISFFPATAWTVAGYFVLFSSTKSSGSMRTFGQVLAIWIFILALAIPICGAWLTFSGQCPIANLIESLNAAGNP